MWKASHGEDPKGDYEGAIGDYAEALKRNPGYWIAHFNMGLLHGSMAEWLEGAGKAARDSAAEARKHRVEAVKCFEKAWEISKDPGVKPLLDAAWARVDSN